LAARWCLNQTPVQSSANIQFVVCGEAAVARALSMASAKFVSTLSSRKVMYAAIIGNFLIVMIKFSAAGWTGSSAMLSEAIHSTVDTANGLLVLYGLNEAKKRPDRIHPLGYGREVYLWSFVVAILIFALGAGVTIYKGIQHVLNPAPIENVGINYIVLALSALLDGSTWWLALKNFKGKNRNLGLFAAVRKSKDPPSFIVLLEDSAALVGLFIAFIGILLSVSFALPILDGASSILIGLVLAVTASLLARETKSLLIGEAADPSLVNSITRLSEKIKGIAHANGILTIHLAPQQVVIALSLEFADELRTPEIEAKVAELERLVCQSHPEVVTIFVKPQTSAGFKKTERSRYGDGDV
jgi:cation diffusion facilitator family transporter